MPHHVHVVQVSTASSVCRSSGDDITQHKVEAYLACLGIDLVISVTIPTQLYPSNTRLSENLFNVYSLSSLTHTAMDLLNQIIACIIDQRDNPSYENAVGLNRDKAAQYTSLSEKIKCYHEKSVEQASQNAAATIFSELRHVEKRNHNLEATLQNIIRQADFADFIERIARKVLNALENAFKKESFMRKTIKNTYEKIIDAADDITRFTREHSVLTSCIYAVIALDILVILTLIIIYALSFNVKSVVEDMIKISYFSNNLNNIIDQT